MLLFFFFLMCYSVLPAGQKRTLDLIIGKKETKQKLLRVL